jgi:lipopolysaccharide export system permease protein
MVNILWRYLLKAYLKVFSLCVVGFIAILLVMRLKEIAKFASLASSLSKVLLYAYYQIPHILPIAIPISSLIAAFLLFQSLSRSHEITALRSCGLPLKKIITPPLILALFISTLNFFICSEIATHYYIKSKEILYEQSSANPLLLLQRQNLLKLGHQSPLNLKNIYVDMRNSSNKKEASNLILIALNSASFRLNLITARQLIINNDILQVYDLSFLSHFPQEKKEGFDNLLIENQKFMSAKASHISNFMKSRVWNTQPKHLPLKEIILRMYHDQNKLQYLFEIAKRFFLGLSAFTLTLVGIAFGLEINKEQTQKGVLIAAFLSLLILLSFLGGKTIGPYSFFIFFFSQILAICLSCEKIKKIEEGIA